jgi:hypothetical protein
MASGRRIEALAAYISVQPHRYIWELHAEKYIPEIETCYFRTAPFCPNGAVKNFPNQG